MIGIIGAMEVEIELLREDLELEKMIEKAGMGFYAGQLDGEDVVLVQCGIGKVNAALCTQILIDDFGAKKIIFTGVAGAVNPKLEIGDIAISTELLQHDVDVTAFGDYNLGEIPGVGKTFPADKELVSLAKEQGKQVADNEQIQIKEGRILSGDQFISSEEDVASLCDNFGGLCTEMEGAAVAQTAYLNETPFVVIRSISDKADKKAEVCFTEFVEKAASNSYKIVTGMIAKLSA